MKQWTAIIHVLVLLGCGSEELGGDTMRGGDGAADPDAGVCADCGEDAGGPACGDGVCGSDEGCDSCVPDCGECDPPAVDPPPPEYPPVPEGAYYLSPSGSDAGDGTASAPWRTFEHALPRLEPGDTLALLDGTYTREATGLPHIDCVEGSVASGTEADPITVMAANERRAFVKGDGGSNAFVLRGCERWNVLGLHVENDDSDTGGGRYSALVVDARHVVLRRMLVAYPNRFENAAAFKILDSERVLLEETEVYYYHRHGISISRSRDITVRRTYQNPRHYEWQPGWYDYNAGRSGDEGIALYPAHRCLVENAIIEGPGRGYEIHAGPNLSYAGEPGGHDNRIVGSIAMSTVGGVFVDSRGIGNDESRGLRPPHGNRFENVLLTGIEEGSVIYLRTAGGIVGTGGVHFDNVTVTGNARVPLLADERGGGHTACEALPDDYFGNAYECAFTVRNSLFFDNDAGTALRWLGSYEVLVEHSSFWSTGDLPDEDPADDAGLVRSTRTVAPTAIETPVYIPEGSNMSGAGSGGADVGASILYRYVDGTLTAVPLWDPETGEFPCGAIVEGLNDVPGESCFDVHERLGVSSDTLPPGYGE